jgi:GT2 family glycosyltransferase
LTNIVVIAKGRDRLTRQALESVIDNTHDYNLTLVMDSLSGPPWTLPKNATEIRTHSGILGELRNLGAYWSAEKFGQGEWICFLDNDVAVFPGWLGEMTRRGKGFAIGIIGGCQHPFHQGRYINIGNRFLCTDAVAGYSMLMSWSTWERFGPFDVNAPGIGQSEDFALCQRVKAAGGIVGYVDPPVLTHTGITNTNGEPATGSELFQRVPGILYL